MDYGFIMTWTYILVPLLSATIILALLLSLLLLGGYRWDRPGWAIMVIGLILVTGNSWVAYKVISLYLARQVLI